MNHANNPQEYEDLGYQYWKKGSVEEALKVFREAGGRFPDNVNVNLCLGFCLLDMDEYVDAPGFLRIYCATRPATRTRLWAWERYI